MPVSFPRETLTKLYHIVSDLRSNLGLALDALHLETATGSLQRLDAILEQSANSKDLENQNCLTPLTFHEKQSDLLRRPLAGSGKWLLEDQRFLAWVNGDNRVLWCPGLRTYGCTYSITELTEAAGAGKTVLT